MPNEIIIKVEYFEYFHAAGQTGRRRVGISSTIFIIYMSDIIGRMSAYVQTRLSFVELCKLLPLTMIDEKPLKESHTMFMPIANY